MKINKTEHDLGNERMKNYLLELENADRSFVRSCHIIPKRLVKEEYILNFKKNLTPLTHSLYL